MSEKFNFRYLKIVWSPFQLRPQRQFALRFCRPRVGPAVLASVALKSALQINDIRRNRHGLELKISKKKELNRASLYYFLFLRVWGITVRNS